MGDRKQAIVIDVNDNVATAIQGLKTGCIAKTESGEITLCSDIPLGHKFALCDILEGEYVIKYGTPIGRAIASIPKGGHVHVHNVEDIVDEIRKQSVGSG